MLNLYDEVPVLPYFVKVVFPTIFFHEGKLFSHLLYLVPVEEGRKNEEVDDNFIKDSEEKEENEV